jgi:hypothetical protein
VRRLGRIFAHAFFHHREIFEQAEAEFSLCARFLALTSRFDLVPSEFLVIPTRIDADEASSDVEPPRLLAAESDIPPVAEPLRRGRSRTDTMVFSEGLNMAEELMKGEELGIPNVSEPDGDAESAAPNNKDSFDMPASIELVQLTKDPEGPRLSAAEHPESSVYPSLAGLPGLTVVRTRAMNSKRAGLRRWFVTSRIHAFLYISSWA